MKTKIRETIALELQRAEMQEKAALEEKRKTGHKDATFASAYWAGYVAGLRVIAEKTK